MLRVKRKCLGRRLKGWGSKGIQDKRDRCKGVEREGKEQQKVVMLLEGVWSCMSEKAAGFEERVSPGAVRCSVMTGAPWEKDFAGNMIQEVIQGVQKVRG